MNSGQTPAFKGRIDFLRVWFEKGKQTREMNDSHETYWEYYFPSPFKALRSFIAHAPFPMPISAQHIKSAIQHLRKSDPVMKQIIKDVGPFTHKLSRNKFDMLVNSILSQQISVAAANTIRDRLRKLANEQVFTAETLVEFTVDQLREAGVSRQKASYIWTFPAKHVKALSISAALQKRKRRDHRRAHFGKGNRPLDRTNVLDVRDGTTGRVSSRRPGHPECDEEELQPA